MADKYTMFKNYMHNELKIGASDIEKWTKEAVYQVAEKYCKNQLNDEVIRKEIVKQATTDGYYSGFTRDIKSAVAKALFEKLEVTMK